MRSLDAVHIASTGTCHALTWRMSQPWTDAATPPEHGALQYIECIEDDVKPGKVTSFPQAVQLKDDEVVAFSWILYKSRDHRDSVNAKVMEDARMKDMMDPKRMPFDGKRMFWGGFKSLVELSSVPMAAD